VTPEAKKPIPAGAESLAALLIEKVRHYERNCRCPKCHAQTLQCIDCDYCVANLKKLVLNEITNPAAAFFSCAEERIGGTLISMKKTIASRKTAKTKLKAKAKNTRAKSAPRAHKKAMKKGPVSIASASGNGTQYDRQVFVRFDTPEIKETVRKAANACGASLSAYIAAAAVEWAENGKSPVKKESVAAAG